MATTPPGWPRQHGPVEPADRDARTRDLAPAWMTSTVLWWDRDGRASVVAGPGAGPLPGGDAAVLHVLTAQDPWGEPQTEARNLELLGDLLVWATGTLSVPWWPATGSELDRSHHEQGIAVAGLGRAEAAAAGARFDQLAIYEVTDELLRVVSCPDARVEAEGARRWAGPDGDPARPAVPDHVAARWWSVYGEVASTRDLSSI